MKGKDTHRLSLQKQDLKYFTNAYKKKLLNQEKKEAD